MPTNEPTTKRTRTKRSAEATPSAPAAAEGAKKGDSAGDESSLFVNSVEKALRVLSVFDARRRELSLTQIAALAELDMSAAQRFTHTLTHLNLLRRDAAAKTYSLSPRMLDFGYQFIAANELVGLATPFLQHLSLETEETVNLTLLDGTEIVFVQRFVSRHVLTPDVIVGTRLPAYCTSSGLAILSALPDDEVREILAKSDLVPYTQHTIFAPDAILKRLETIRRNGYAHTEDEMYIGDIATAVVIVGSDGRPRGAINVAVSRARWKGAEDEQRVASLLIAAGRAISSRA
ncbi:transcriptional regulator, IclR family [Cupriavidus sp. OV038]|jgi:DNA-binding IclR family transcriptional regulator|uniref:IclR family transcriptional regulator n=1 Tax=unclassified Cupriavidus TaxID=2640874 RepID=UPI0008EF5B27|nr:MULTISPECIES: IclR family transcriptional regulator [unclassified Cupriavidus]SFC56931.1 transcriptional regulator, IclR family [Cupriavidus sp. OV038]SFP45612.1 transcriptional regulator, IclR family [Cupriavidus sp. OV096]